jgi:hypothetical protein
MQINDMTAEQKRAIVDAYIRPSPGKLSAVVGRIKAVGVPIATATSYLWALGYISYNDKLMIERIANEGR